MKNRLRGNLPQPYHLLNVQLDETKSEEETISVEPQVEEIVIPSVENIVEEEILSAQQIAVVEGGYPGEKEGDDLGEIFFK